MGRYLVQFKAFKTGEWYTKTNTDSKRSAFSFAKFGNYGRACRLIDTETNQTLFETPEEPIFKEVNGDVSKFLRKNHNKTIKNDIRYGCRFYD